jgi:hypothetical protein
MQTTIIPVTQYNSQQQSRSMMFQNADGSLKKERFCGYI